MTSKLANVLFVLDGKKTYLVALITALLNLLVAFNVLSVEHLTQVNVVLASLGLGALRAGVSKV
jgi:hypothetical protein